MVAFRRGKALPAQAAEVAGVPAGRLAAPEPQPDGRRSIADHRRFLLRHVRALAPLGLGVLDSVGRPLCEPIRADLDLPLFTSSRVDGYAVRWADLTGATPTRPVRLPVMDNLDTPAYRGAPLTPGTAIRVAPGAPIPEGADSVLPVEQTDGGEEEVLVRADVEPGANLRLAGSDLADGTELFAVGDLLDAGAAGALAEVGIDKVLIRPRPRVVVVTLGVDLVAPGMPLTSRVQRYDATTVLLAAAARADGAQVFALPSLAEDVARLSQVLTEQLIRADLILVAGARDGGAVAREALADLGPTDLCEVAMEPGGAQGFAVIGEEDTPVVVVPGTPVSAYVSYLAFVRPVLRRLAGLEPLATPSVVRPAWTVLEGTFGVTDLIPVRLADHGAERVGVPGRESALDVARATALAVLPPEVTRIGAHDDVECWLFDPAGR